MKSNVWGNESQMLAPTNTEAYATLSMTIIQAKTVKYYPYRTKTLGMMLWIDLCNDKPFTEMIR